MNPRIIIGALLGVTAIAAVPSAANAAATCSYSSSARTATIQYGASDSSVTVINRGAIRFSEGTNAPRDCGVASTSNTDRIVVKASANPTGAQNTIIDERNGDFSDSNPRLRFTVLTGTGGTG